MKIDEYIKQNHRINYCEVIIDSNGDINNAVPSHMYYMTNHVCKLENLTYIELDQLIPIDASPLHWLLDKYNYASIWYNMAIVSVDVNDVILNCIQKLINAGIVDDNYRIVYTDEYKRANILKEFKRTKDKSLLDKIINREDSFMFKNN